MFQNFALVRNVLAKSYMNLLESKEGIENAAMSSGERIMISSVLLSRCLFTSTKAFISLQPTMLDLR